MKGWFITTVISRAHTQIQFQWLKWTLLEILGSAPNFRSKCSCTLARFSSSYFCVPFLNWHTSFHQWFPWFPTLLISSTQAICSVSVIIQKYFWRHTMCMWKCPRNHWDSWYHIPLYCNILLLILGGIHVGMSSMAVESLVFAIQYFHQKYCQDARDLADKRLWLLTLSIQIVFVITVTVAMHMCNGIW